jgi:hypothetical protein
MLTRGVRETSGLFDFGGFLPISPGPGGGGGGGTGPSIWGNFPGIIIAPGGGGGSGSSGTKTTGSGSGTAGKSTSTGIFGGIFDWGRWAAFILGMILILAGLFLMAKRSTVVKTVIVAGKKAASTLAEGAEA